MIKNKEILSLMSKTPGLKLATRLCLPLCIPIRARDTTILKIKYLHISNYTYNLARELIKYVTSIENMSRNQS